MEVETKSSAECFRALADPTRLRILKMLSCCPERLEQVVEGPTAGEVCCQITGADRINSTISHHLKELREAGLIRVVRNGKSMCCSLNREELKRIAAELVSLADGGPDDCC